MAWLLGTGLICAAVFAYAYIATDDPAQQKFLLRPVPFFAIALFGIAFSLLVGIAWRFQSWYESRQFRNISREFRLNLDRDYFKGPLSRRHSGIKGICRKERIWGQIAGHDIELYGYWGATIGAHGMVNREWSRFYIIVDNEQEAFYEGKAKVESVRKRLQQLRG